MTHSCESQPHYLQEGPTGIYCCQEARVLIVPHVNHEPGRFDMRERCSEQCMRIDISKYPPMLRPYGITNHSVHLG